MLVWAPRLVFALIAGMAVGLGAGRDSENGAGLAMARAADGSGPDRSPTMRTARDPSIAVQEEYEIARKRGTPAALELFIRRHADDPLAETARQELQRLRGKDR
jgi:hypothetical protein